MGRYDTSTKADTPLLRRAAATEPLWIVFSTDWESGSSDPFDYEHGETEIVMAQSAEAAVRYANQHGLFYYGARSASKLADNQRAWFELSMASAYRHLTHHLDHNGNCDVSTSPDYHPGECWDHLHFLAECSDAMNHLRPFRNPTGRY